mmetsp:Transcript_19358/g.68494  ORF Transcript_19358/g.68494 Transcript_19358/m.68494 type:complete len:489 (-) Transcript_19358:138-1604(-)
MTGGHRRLSSSSSRLGLGCLARRHVSLQRVDLGLLHLLALLEQHAPHLLRLLLLADALLLLDVPPHVCHVLLEHLLADRLHQRLQVRLVLFLLQPLLLADVEDGLLEGARRPEPHDALAVREVEAAAAGDLPLDPAAHVLVAQHVDHGAAAVLQAVRKVALVHLAVRVRQLAVALAVPVLEVAVVLGAVRVGERAGALPLAALPLALVLDAVRVFGLAETALPVLAPVPVVRPAQRERVRARSRHLAAPPLAAVVEEVLGALAVGVAPRVRPRARYGAGPGLVTDLQRVLALAHLGDRHVAHEADDLVAARAARRQLLRLLALVVGLVLLGEPRLGLVKHRLLLLRLLPLERALVPRVRLKDSLVVVVRVAGDLDGVRRTVPRQPRCIGGVQPSTLQQLRVRRLFACLALLSPPLLPLSRRVLRLVVAELGGTAAQRRRTRHGAPTTILTFGASPCARRVGATVTGPRPGAGRRDAVAPRRRRARWRS